MNKNARTLSDLNRGGGSSWGAAGSQGGAENGVLRCMMIVFPGFGVRTTTFRYMVVCAIVFAAMTLVHILRPGYEWRCIEYDFGAKQTWAITKEGQLWRLVLPAFLHDGLLHLFWNAFSMFMVGFVVERSFLSTHDYTVMLFLGAVGGNLASAVMRPYSLAVGASGPIWAVFGAFGVYIWMRYERLGDDSLRILCVCLILFAFSLMNAMASNSVDMWAHLGGLFVGIVMGARYLVAETPADAAK